MKYFFMNPDVCMVNDVWPFLYSVCAYATSPICTVSTWGTKSLNAWGMGTGFMAYFPYIQANYQNVSVSQYMVRRESLYVFNGWKWDWHSQWVKLEHLPLCGKLSWGRKLAFSRDKEKRTNDVSCQATHGHTVYLRIIIDVEHLIIPSFSPKLSNTHSWKNL